MKYADDDWKFIMANSLDDAEREGWFTTKLAILMVEGLYGGAEYATSDKIKEMRDYIHTTIMRERLNGENLPEGRIH